MQPELLECSVNSLSASGEQRATQEVVRPIDGRRSDDGVDHPIRAVLEQVLAEATVVVAEGNAVVLQLLAVAQSNAVELFRPRGRRRVVGHLGWCGGAASHRGAVTTSQRGEVSQRFALHAFFTLLSTMI